MLQGSVRKVGNRVRITTQLTDGISGGHLWAERYDRDLLDIFAVQDEVTQEIVAALAIWYRYLVIPTGTSPFEDSPGDQMGPPMILYNKINNLSACSLHCQWSLLIAALEPDTRIEYRKSKIRDQHADHGQ